MTKPNTVLTDEEIEALAKRHLNAFAQAPELVKEFEEFARAIEQAILAKQAAQVERNFCPRCGKRNSPGLIHTCTPPASSALVEAAEKVELVGYMPAYEIERLQSGHDGRARAAKFGPSAMDGDIAIYTRHPTTPTQVETQWQPIETAPEGELVVVGWIDPEDKEDRHELDYKADGGWVKHLEHYEHVTAIGGWGVSETPPYTHWQHIGPVPAAIEAEKKGQV